MEDLVNALANSQVPNGSLKKAMQPTNVDMTLYFADSELCWPKYSVQWVASSRAAARREISQPQITTFSNHLHIQAEVLERERDLRLRGGARRARVETQNPKY